MLDHLSQRPLREELLRREELEREWLDESADSCECGYWETSEGEKIWEPDPDCPKHGDEP